MIKIDDKSNRRNIKLCLQRAIFAIHFHISSQTQANSNPGQFLMSFWNGLAGSSPKLASRETRGDIVTAGKR
jgi:hypothetical protein